MQVKCFLFCIATGSGKNSIAHSLNSKLARSNIHKQPLLAREAA